MSRHLRGTAEAPFELAISIRTFAEEIEGDKEATSEKTPEKGAKTKQRESSGASLWTLCFDTETTTDAAQRFRIGFYQLREGNRLDEERVVVDGDALSPAETETVRLYAAERGLGEPMTLDAFRHEVLLKRGFAIGATIATFNGPFDFARVALGASDAHATKWRRKMRGGFSFALSTSGYDPRIQIKSLNPRAALVELTSPSAQKTSRSKRKHFDDTPAYRGHFIDVKTFASALTSRSHSLETLTRALGTPTQKTHSSEHGKALTFEYLDYARLDVQATWECFERLKAKYVSYGLNAAATTIISEASIGKAALETMGIRPFVQVQPGGIDRGLTSLMLSTYYGGRTEVRIRRKKVRVMHTDFTSMYPTVCSLQGLWPFVIGEGFTSTDATQETRALLDTATPAMFQDPQAWRRLAVLVRVRPDRDLLPIRTEYPGQKHATIGLNFLTYNGTLWVTLADCLAAKFLCGKAPVIEQAIGFTPGPMQSGLRPIRLMGGDPIDPCQQDFYRELIRSREALKAKTAGKSNPEKEQIEEVRQALKITANSTSYGIFVQVNVNAEPRGIPMRVYRPDGSSFVRRMTKVETPGPWFHPLVATLITGAARLMLALAERQVVNAGLDWAFCDTDSLAIAMPEGMDEPQFLSRARGVGKWFRPLNPYGMDEPILKLEDVNFAPGGSDTLEPLYCWAISSKRYALFNIGADGEPIIRKASAHGLGHLLSPYRDAEAPSHIPPPLKEVISGKEKLQRWHYDVWFTLLQAVLAKRPDDVRFDFHPALSRPTVSRYTATSPEMLGWFKTWNGEKAYAEKVKPFGFMHLLHVSSKPPHPDTIPDPVEAASGTGEMFPVAPFDADLSASVSKAFDRISGDPIDVSRLQTYVEALASYPWRSEGKFLNGEGYDSGKTERCHVEAAEIALIGKEADRWEEEFYLGARMGQMAIEYGGDPAAASDAFNALRSAIAAFPKALVARETGVARSTLTKIERGEPVTTQVQPLRITRAVRRLLAARSQAGRDKLMQIAHLRAVVLQEGGVRAAARKLGVDASNLSKTLRGGADDPTL